MSEPRACISSGINTASGANALIVSSTAGFLCGVNIIVASTGDLEVIGYDSSASASGTKIYHRKFDSSAVMGTGGSRFDVLPIPCAVSKGIVLTITGTAPDGAIVYHAPRA